ncbi:hypothetical protein [Aliiroseovarius crassostreae]|uniref:hypothetical protein n=1 Tax=Aliiroseovarius crassostreae TaxID=154981 RepID=UPI0021FE342F|nr:hypothetical protein [Aliiroseovarius crassostreae]UWQ03720.1 hypothetical protein K3X22_08315 [Aliiroseovarius crassostreae]
MPTWENTPPQLYSIVTGFFPEASPKETWATNPRPLLVCGTAQDPETNMYFCRVAYGTTKVKKAHENDLVIGNFSTMNALGLKYPTAFVINAGEQMVIMPWIERYFQPWSGRKTPFLSRLPTDMQKHVGYTLANMDDLPQF